MAWAPNYAASEDLAAFVRIEDSADDVVLGLAIATASRTIDGPNGCGRQFGKLDAPAPRYYTAQWDRRRCVWYVRIEDLMTTTGLVVKYDSVEDQTYASTITAYRLGPVNAAAEGRPWTELVIRSSSAVQPTALEDGVEITALWGWTEVPPAIEQACLLQASRIVSRRDSPHGIAGSPEAGSEIRILARLDPDVAVAVRPYRRVWGAV